MGLEQNAYLKGKIVYGCKDCNTHMAVHEAIVSKHFRGQHGSAFLFSAVENIRAGDPEERDMTTGRHIVRDILCKQCKNVVGWKYEMAFEEPEEYKVGKYILEMELMHTVA